MLPLKGNVSKNNNKWIKFIQRIKNKKSFGILKICWKFFKKSVEELEENTEKIHKKVKERDEKQKK